ncbi:MAG TPA: MBL fold metallo-hydrolase, partial [Longimicrobiaceae bacterium]|nr:MBL fold metallo-hydrolase [Longimicrobiaceae bacterium]
MRTRRLCLPALAALLGAVLPLAARTAPRPPGFEVQRIAEGVFALVRTEPRGAMFEANSVFIVGDRDVVVVDGGSNPASAREVLAALRTLTPKPVRYVVNTHWHDDHVLGNQVYRDSFPGVEFVAHATAAADLATDGATNRSGFVAALPGTIAYFRDLLQKNRGMESEVLSDEERESHAASIALWERYLAEAPGVRVVAPTVAVEDSLVLVPGERPVVVRYLGRGHTRGDVVVHLPADGVVVAGDLVVWPVPSVGSTSYPADFGRTLERLLALRPGIVVPGHGSVQRDDAYVRLVARMLASMARQTGAAAARGETLEQARKSVDLAEFRDALVGDSPVRALLFQHYVAGPGVARAYEQATAPRGAAPAGLGEARASLLAADRAYADSSARGSLVDGILRMLAPDGILVTGTGSPLPRGADEARRFLESDTLRLRSTLTWRPLRADVSADGTRGYSYGFTEVRLPDGSSAPGKYSAFWRRGADGSWKVAAYRRGWRPEGPVPAAP